ncbi:MAG: hypothetical protein AB2708_06370, partial [Candidatus Thiodiazotropha taylori]
CKLLYIEHEHKEVETKTKTKDCVNATTQTDEAVDTDETSVKKLSLQANPFIDFRYIPRDEPDGQSRSDSTTYLKIANGTSNKLDNDNITRVKEVNTTFSDYRQSYTEDWIDSLDVLIGSYLNGSHDDISNWSQESNSLNSEVDNADQCSSEDEKHYNGTETSNPYVINDLSFDSDDMFGD